MSDREAGASFTQSLADDAEFLRSILASSGDCIKVLDLDAKLLFMTEAGRRVMEVSDFNAVRGCPWPDFWEGEGNIQAQAAVRAATAGGTGHFQGPARTMAGTLKWWDVQVTPILGPDGRPQKLLSVSRDITATWEIDAELRRLAGLVEQTADFIGVAAPDWRVLFVNPAGCRLVGLPGLEAARGHVVEDFFAPVDRGMLAQVVLPAVQQAGGWEGALNFRHFGTGTTFPVQCTIFPLRDAGGIVTGYGTVTRDLRDLRRADERRAALLELGDRLGKMDDTASMAFIAAEIMGRTLGVSGAGYGTMSPDAEEALVERDWTAPGAASISGRHRMRDYGSHIEDLRRGETVAIDDVRHDPRTSAHGANLDAIATRAAINLPLIEHGRLVALFFVVSAEPRRWTVETLSFVRDVAERTRAAIERRRAENGMRDLAALLERQVAERTADRNRFWELSSEIMLRCAFDGTIIAVNPAWTEMLGWAEAELVGSAISDFIHPDDLERTLEGVRSSSLGQSFARFENRYLCKDGGHRWINWSSRPADGMINAVGRDFTAEKERADALKLAEDRLRQSQKMEAVGQLTGGLAHDFNNLLTGIAGSLELLQTRIAQGRLKDLDRYITAAEQASRRAASLTHRLLAFSRQQTLDPAPTDINRQIATMEELIRRTVGPAIGIEVVRAAGLWPALVDPNQLENALLNLCLNARDAMPDGGRITIETANMWLDERGARERDLPPGQYLSLCVTDTGVGMTSDVVARAFDPFFTTKPIGQGTGLGLSMIYGFARQSGGQVRIYSEVGHGTTMCLYLPRYHGPEAGVYGAVEPAEPPARAGQDETVLIVDDEPTVRMLVTEVLEDLGYRAIEAADGPAALKILQSGIRVDLLVTDVGLPGGMNGRQVADAGRTFRPGLKVLFITGYAENAALGNGHLKPGMHVLTKPFALQTLARRIKELIAGP